MEKVSDHTSSWVFVHSDTKSNDNVNTFHLDCSREPIQELTEHDLSLPGSDVESDKGTDTSEGISIISDSEIPYEERCCNQNRWVIIDDQIVEDRVVCTRPLCIQPSKDFTNEWEWKLVLTPLTLVSVWVVVLAITFALYSSLKVQNNSTPEEPIGTFDGSRITHTFDEIVDNTISCVCNKKQSQALSRNQVKQCVHERLSTNSKPVDNFNSKNTMTDNFEQKFTPKYDKKLKKDIKMTKSQQTKKKQKYDSSGEWYSNMHINRANLRKHKEKGDKAQWYFNRNNARQQNRGKNSRGY